MFSSYQGSEKDKRREAFEKEERAKKVLLSWYLFAYLVFFFSLFVLFGNWNGKSFS